MLARAVELAPGFAAARASLRDAIYHAPRDEAMAALDQQLARAPGHLGYRSLKAALLDRSGDYDAAIEIYRAMLADKPDESSVWMTLGHVLKTVGRTPECIAAYRRSVELQANGEAWWSLANIKTFRFDNADIATMRDLLKRPNLEKEARFHIEFALGKALEDRADYADSFAHYAKGNRLRRETISYSPAHLADQRQRAARLFTPEFIAARADWGTPQPDPIFVVGLPRSGSTLVEQILASHPAIEGTMELDDLQRVVRRVDATPPGGRYPRHWPASTKPNLPRSASNISRPAASSARRTRRASSTNCPAISPMSG
jgi:tetratricopeptide (TPR) repeat protein